MKIVIKPKIKNFICTTSHPSGCEKNIKEYISYIKNLYINKSYANKNALIIGSSAGYGLLTRLVLTFGYKYNTIGIFNEKKPHKEKTATPGWYNTAFLENEAKKQNIYTHSLNADAFSNNTINQIIQLLKNNIQKIDILIYSIATSKYIDENTQKIYKTALKPINDNITTKTLNIEKKIITNINVNKANNEEIENTQKIMGGYLWEKWITRLQKNNLINENFKTIAYSYNGPQITHHIYKNGTIGLAKKHLNKTAKNLNNILKKYNGKAFISFNEAIITQASMAIPSVSLYIAILNTIKKTKNINENSIDHIKNLFDNIENEKNILINLDKTEMRNDIQQNISYIWNLISTDNMKKYINVNDLVNSYLKIYGFNHNDVDYNIKTDTVVDNHIN